MEIIVFFRDDGMDQTVQLKGRDARDDIVDFAKYLLGFEVEAKRMTAVQATASLRNVADRFCYLRCDGNGK